MSKKKLPTSPSKLLSKALEIIAGDLEAISKLPSPRDPQVMAQVEKYARALGTLADATKEAQEEARASLARLSPAELTRELDAARAGLTGAT